MRTWFMLGTMLLGVASVTPAMADAVQLLTPNDGTEQSDPRSLLAAPQALTDTGSETPPTSRSTSSSYDPMEVDQQPKMQTRHFGAQATLECEVSKRPGSLVVVNRSLMELPPGTRIKWQFPDTRLRGFFALVGPLSAGARLEADGVIGAEARAKGSCTARVI